LFKHFDMCIAAARLYTRHHQPSVAANQATVIAAAAAAAAAAATCAASARRKEDEMHSESSEHDDVLLASVDKPTPAKDVHVIGGRYFQHTPFSPGSSLTFPTGMPDSPYRARKYVRRGVLSRGGDDAHGSAHDDGENEEEEEDDDDEDDPMGEEVTLSSTLFLKTVLRPEMWILIIGTLLSLIYLTRRSTSPAKRPFWRPWRRMARSWRSCGLRKTRSTRTCWHLSRTSS